MHGKQKFTAFGIDVATNMSLKRLLSAQFLLALLLLTSCVIPIPIAIPYVNKERYAAKLEPPEQYNHPYNGQVVERVVSVAEARTLCMSMGADLLGVACSWQNNGTCYIVVPNDEYAPVDTFRRHEIAHCNGWPANHPRDV